MGDAALLQPVAQGRAGKHQISSFRHAQIGDGITDDDAAATAVTLHHRGLGHQLLFTAERAVKVETTAGVGPHISRHQLMQALPVGTEDHLHQRHQAAGHQHEGQARGLECIKKGQKTRPRLDALHALHHGLQVLGREDLCQARHALTQVDFKAEELALELSPALRRHRIHHQIKGVNAGDGAVEITEHRGGGTIHGAEQQEL